MLIVNGRVYPMDGAVIESGFVEIGNGVIKSVGPMSDAPSDSETFDAEGGYVLPGLVDAHCHLGMWEDALGFEGSDGNEMTDPVTPHLRAIDAINPRDRCFEDALKAGVTAVMTGPGSANPIGGQFAALKTSGGRVDDMVLLAPASLKLALGENPKGVYHGKDKSPETRMATAAIIRDAFYRAGEYLKKKEKARCDKEKDPPTYDIKLEALVLALTGALRANFHAHRADDIFTAIRISKEFGLDYALVHCTEGHLIAKELAAEGARVITGPSLCDRSKPELLNLTFDTPGILSRAGVLTAICTDHPVIPLSYLILCAALAHKAGMDELEAMRAVTRNPAIIAGIGGRVGALLPGLDADIAVYTAHPFDVMARVSAVFVDGGRTV